MELYRTQFRAMGGENEIVVAASSEALATQAMRAAADEVLRIQAKYSRYVEDSVLSRINRAAGSDAALRCDTETLDLLRFADTLYHQSGGLFDITSGVLRKAWNFALPVLPAAEALAPLLALVGWDAVERRGDSIRLPRVGMEIDFGGFGKEYAADRAAAVLSAQGLQHGYVNLGGDIRAIGPQPGGEPWLIGVQDPRRKGEIVATIPVVRGALATSGDYERFFEIDGTRYCHVLDPRSGYPVSYWSSVSVLAPMAIVAGSYSTIAMLKREAGLGFLREQKLSFLALDSQGQVFSG